MYGWSKWGGATMGLAKEELPTWYCQVCGDEQILQLPSYMIPMDYSQRDFIRVCASCKAKAVRRRVTLSYELIRIVKSI